MAESEKPREGSCTFLFKKSNKKFSGRKRKASDSEKGLLFNSLSDHLKPSELPVPTALELFNDRLLVSVLVVLYR